MAKKFYFFTGITLLLEVGIISIGPWFVWLVDAPVKAGVTLVSEYSIIVAMRWTVILLLQFDMFQSVLLFFYSIINKILLALRNLGDNEQPRNSDGTFATYGSNQLVKKSVGRPKKS